MLAVSDLFTGEELIEAAARRTGLVDFGETAWRDGLDALLASAAAEARLNPMGRGILRSWIQRRLENRLRVIDWVKRHPELRQQRVERPLVVLGMLRTGTTLLCELLARDPANRPLMKWEALDCVPPPAAKDFSSDPRIARMVEEMEQTYRAVPRLKAVHWEPGDGPTECVALLTQSFRSQDWYGLFRLPSYVAWLHGCDMLPGYRYHRLCLQLLQAQAPGRWSLKAPGHALALEALSAVYPDARFIVTHRDPRRVVASSVSLSAHSRPETLAEVDVRSSFAPMWLDTLALMVERLMDFRDRHGDARFHDVRYEDFVRDPVREIRRAYARFGEELGAEAEAAMRARLEASPRGRYGTHRYALHDFGLAPEQVDERFERYCRRFDVPRED